MSILTRVQTVTIAQSGTVSGAFKCDNASIIALSIPVITSGEVYLRGAMTDVSADYYRILKEDGSADFPIIAAAGSVCAIITNHVNPFPFGKIETQNPQTAAVNLQVIFKLS